MRFIGDVHGHTDRLQILLQDGKPSFQIGDMGLGFVKVPTFKNLSFIRGNHDDPALCKTHPNYAGEFGFKDGLFFCGGAFSIDYAWRQEAMRRNPHITPVWWEDEELNVAQLGQALALYERVKPLVVATHEAPTSAKIKLLTELAIGFRPEKLVPSRTDKAFQQMLKIHRPQYWLFGHYHIQRTWEDEGTLFSCLDELRTMELNYLR